VAFVNYSPTFNRVRLVHSLHAACLARAAVWHVG
jgi:dGTP triphosphohydrolase